MTTRRSRSIEHGLEKRGKPVVLPLIALLLALGASFADRQPSTADPETAASNKAVGQGEIAVSAIYQGVTGKGDYYSCVRPAEIRPQHPTYKRLLEACVMQTLERR